MVSTLKRLNYVYMLASLRTYASAFFCMLQFNSRRCFPQGDTSQLRNGRKPLGTATVSVTLRVYTALFQNLRFCELGRCFLQTNSLRDLELVPMALTKTRLRVELIARESSKGPCDLGLGTLH
jgi:hypothetical protein